MGISFFASAIRVHLWKELLNSLRGSKYEYEVVFAGFIDKSLYEPIMKEYPEFKYIQTGNIKPAQDYEIARRACRGELVCWCADDCIFSKDFVNEIVRWFEPLGDVLQKSYILSCKTNENNKNESMQHHRFFGKNLNTPIMAPLGVMRRDKLEEMGGLDKRYICGQYENDIVMRFRAEGGNVLIVEFVCVNIEHLIKHQSQDDFKGGYNEDREQLENSWCVGGYQPHEQGHVVQHGVRTPYMYLPIANFEVTLNRNDEFQPYPKDISYTKSELPKGQWE